MCHVAGSFNDPVWIVWFCFLDSQLKICFNIIKKKLTDNISVNTTWKTWRMKIFIPQSMYGYYQILKIITTMNNSSKWPISFISRLLFRKWCNNPKFVCPRTTKHLPKRRNQFLHQLEMSDLQALFIKNVQNVSWFLFF